MASGKGDNDEAAAWGIASWMLGVLTGLVHAFDVFVGQGAPVVAGNDPHQIVGGLCEACPSVAQHDACHQD